MNQIDKTQIILSVNQEYAAEIMRDLVAEDPELSDWLKVRIDAWLKCVEQPEQEKAG